MRDTISILRDGSRLLGDAHLDFAAQLSASALRLERREWRVLVSGLCSVGKSSFVCALWGDSDLLPTAVRDCTQTNTSIRAPHPGENDPRIFLQYLGPLAARNFALKGLAVHRLVGMLADHYGLAMPRLDEMLPDERVRCVAREARKLFESRPDLRVLNEPLSDELDQLENFIGFIESPAYLPGASVEARWEDRREHLMGLRLPDGRLAGTGRLMALEHVEIVRRTAWQPANGLPVPNVIDTPWIPALHNARREDLILEQARRADILLVLSLPQRYDCENWLLSALRERPELTKTTVVIFNQADTCDPRTLFSRDGFAGIFEDNRDRLVRLGLDPANILVACARMRFLKNAQDANAANAAQSFAASNLAERITRLEKVLGQMREQARSRPDSDLKNRLLAACDPADAGVETTRRKLEQLAAGPVEKRRIAAALDSIIDFDPVDLPSAKRAEWTNLRSAAMQVKSGGRSPF